MLVNDWLCFVVLNSCLININIFGYMFSFLSDIGGKCLWSKIKFIFYLIFV